MYMNVFSGKFHLWKPYLFVHQFMNGSSFLVTSDDSVSESGYSVKFDVSPGFPICGMNLAGIFFYDILYQSIGLNHL